MLLKEKEHAPGIDTSDLAAKSYFVVVFEVWKKS